MLEMGASKPGPDALEVFTGQREMSGQAMIEYFKPLQEWLKQENKGKQRSEEHTSELQSLMRISYAVFCLKKKTKNTKQTSTNQIQYLTKTIYKNKKNYQLL